MVIGCPLLLGNASIYFNLFHTGNEICKVEGLETLQDLRELVLDRNKIKDLSEYSFVNQWNLVELHIEENRLRDLSHLHFLENLQRLYLGSNRLQVRWGKLQLGYQKDSWYVLKQIINHDNFLCKHKQAMHDYLYY